MRTKNEPNHINAPARNHIFLAHRQHFYIACYKWGKSDSPFLYSFQAHARFSFQFSLEIENSCFSAMRFVNFSSARSFFVSIFVGDRNIVFFRDAFCEFFKCTLVVRFNFRWRSKNRVFDSFSAMRFVNFSRLAYARFSFQFSLEI